MTNISHLTSAFGSYGRTTNRSTESLGTKNRETEETTASSKVKNTSSLPDGVVENIQRMAKEDAKKNIYMDKEFMSYTNHYLKKHISPNRSKLMMMLNPMIRNARSTNGKPIFFH